MDSLFGFRAMARGSEGKTTAEVDLRDALAAPGSQHGLVLLPEDPVAPAEARVSDLREELLGPAGRYDLVLLEPGPDGKRAAGGL